MGDTWLPEDQDPRAQEVTWRGEREVVVGYLEHYRTTLELKCDGLTPEQLATAAVPPSRISLLGMVRHLARVEQSWTRRVIEGRPELPRLFQDEDGGFELDLDRVGPAYVAEAWDLWRTEVAHAREVLERTPLDALVSVHGDEIEVREVVVHLVEEYARHLGHVDLVREVLDGRTGQ